MLKITHAFAVVWRCCMRVEVEAEIARLAAEADEQVGEGDCEHVGDTCRRRREGDLTSKIAVRLRATVEGDDSSREGIAAEERRLVLCARDHAKLFKVERK